MQSQKAVTAYLKNRQLLAFGFARQNTYQVNTKHLHNIYTMPAQRLRRWSSIV